MEYSDRSQNPFFSSSATFESDDLCSPKIELNINDDHSPSTPSSSPVLSDSLESFSSTPTSDFSSSLYTGFSSLSLTSSPCSNSSNSPFTNSKEKEELSGIIMSKYLQFINQKLSLPSDRITDIIEVDFPRDLSIPMFYQLLSQMNTIGVQIFKQCTILKFVSFAEWNNCHLNNNFISNNFSNTNENSSGNKIYLWELMDHINNDNNNHYNYCLQRQHQFENSLPAASTSSSSKYNNLEMIGYGNYLSCQSELFSKIFYHISSSIFHCPIRSNKYYLTRVTIPIPSISTIELIINWLYTHNDQIWLSAMNKNNFEEICKNVIFLGLGDEALKVLEIFL
ncbi:21580_t:CDS:2, partial [Entrophospora sp. SA101]